MIIPRFSDLSEQAELAQTQGIAAGLRTGAVAVQAMYRSQGHSVRVQNLAGYGDGTIDTNNLGYPIGIDKGNANENVGQGNAGCTGVWRGVLIDPPSVSESNNNQQYRAYRHTSAKICSYVYREGGDNGDQSSGLLVIRYDSRDGSVVVCGQRADLTSC